MTDQPLNVLFLRTGNSARSTFAETLVNHLGQERFLGYSAGSHRKGEVHPLTIRELQRNSLPTDGLGSNDTAEYERAGSPHMDFVFTVRDQAAAEVCPVWPGHRMAAHWGVEDPAAVNGDERTKEAAFAKALHGLRYRISIFVDLPLESLSKPQLKEKLGEIGRFVLANPGPEEKGDSR